MSLEKKLDKLKQKKKKERFSESFEDFGKLAANKNFKSHANSIPDLSLEISEDKKHYYYTFSSQGLKKSCINVYYEDKYLIIEQNKKNSKSKLIRKKDKLKRFSSKSFFVKEDVEDDFNYKFKGDRLLVTFKKSSK